MTSPVEPSITTMTPGRTVPLARATPTTAGTWSERARMAVWCVLLPVSLANPWIFRQSTCAAIDGVSSSATRTESLSTSRNRSAPSPLARPRFMRSLPTTSATSPRRSRR